MRKTKDEKIQIKNPKLSRKEMSVETLKGFILSLSLQILAKVLLAILNSEVAEKLTESVLRKLINLIS